MGTVDRLAALEAAFDLLAILMTEQEQKRFPIHNLLGDLIAELAEEAEG